MSLDLSNQSVLIVDDVREMRTSLRAIVKSLGADEVHEAKSGAEALEQLDDHEVDIVLCDYNLDKGRDGQQVFEEAKEYGKISPHAVFIMITAESNMDVVMSVVEHSPDGYLIKPLNKSVLELRIEKVLQKKRIFRQIEVEIANEAYSKAAAICDVLLQKHPKMKMDLLRIKAEALLKARDADNLAELCAGLLMDREIPWATLYMGCAKYLAGDNAKARALFVKAIEQNNVLMEAYDWLVRVDREAGDFDRAQQTQQQAVELSPKSIRRQQVLADLAAKNGDHKAARKAFNAAVDLGSNSCYARIDDQVGLLNAVSETGGAEEALRVLKDIKQKRKRSRPLSDEKADWRLILSEGELLLSNNQASDAKASVTAALGYFKEESRDVADPSVIALAKACYGVGMVPEAQEIMNRVIRENHDREDIIAAAREMYDALGMHDVGDDLIDSARRAVVEINNQGVGLAKQGKLDEAIEMLTKASDELPGNLTITLNVLQVVLSQIRKAGFTNQRRYLMSEYVQRAETIDPENAKLAKIRDKLALVMRSVEQHEEVPA